MSTELIFRIIFGFFIGSFIVMQIYFALRIRRAKEQAGDSLSTEDESRLSYRGSVLFNLFHTVFHIFLVVWAAYLIWIDKISTPIGIVFIIVALVLLRKSVKRLKKLRPVPSINVPVNLSIHANIPDGITPRFIKELLNEESVIRAIQNDLNKTAQVGYKEIWRLGLITPEQDKFDLSIYQQSRQERLKNIKFNALLNADDKIPVKRSATLHNPYYFNIQLNNILIMHGAKEPYIRRYPGWNYSLSTKMVRGQYRNLRDIMIETNSATSKNRSRYLPKFLQEDGFPLKNSYVDGDPLSMGRGGTIVLAREKLIVIYPQYFVQRRLIDDEGNLIYLGLDENFTHGSSWFAVSMKPSLSTLLLNHISNNDFTPILRYRSFPYASDFMLPILDTPLSANGWADLFIDTRGKAKLFIAKENTMPRWHEMMNRLRQLFFIELTRKSYHLLGLTKDKSHLNDYLAKKMEILQDYYIIQDWRMPGSGLSRGNVFKLVYR